MLFIIHTGVRGRLHTDCSSTKAGRNHKWHKHGREKKTAWKHCLSSPWWACDECVPSGESSPGGQSLAGRTGPVVPIQPGCCFRGCGSCVPWTCRICRGRRSPPAGPAPALFRRWSSRRRRWRSFERPGSGGPAWYSGWFHLWGRRRTEVRFTGLYPFTGQEFKRSGIIPLSDLLVADVVGMEVLLLGVVTMTVSFPVVELENIHLPWPRYVYLTNFKLSSLNFDFW